jgi:hypothetical protein
MMSGNKALGESEGTATGPKSPRRKITVEALFAGLMSSK